MISSEVTTVIMSSPSSNNEDENSNSNQLSDLQQELARIEGVLNSQCEPLHSVRGDSNYNVNKITDSNIDCKNKQQTTQDDTPSTVLLSISTDDQFLSYHGTDKTEQILMGSANAHDTIIQESSPISGSDAEIRPTGEEQETQGASEQEKMSLGAKEDAMNECDSTINGCSMRSERSNSCSNAMMNSSSAADQVQIIDMFNDNNNSSPLDRSISCSSSNVANEMMLSNKLALDKDAACSSNTSLASTFKKIINNHDNIDNINSDKPGTTSKQSGSRFFSSKLNTGSLWSLLSGGGGDQNVNESADPVPIIEPDSSKYSVDNSKFKQPRDQQISIFERAVQFSKRGQQQAENLASWIETNNNKQDKKMGSSLGSQSANPTIGTHSLTQTQIQLGKIRYRFLVKYVGSSILHKNFTLSMLEWVAKDIRRHTLKAAAGQGRQTSFRDINFEIYGNKLIGSNLKDGSCIFVHPMHLVSKYVQLQLDQNCFAYIIREPRDQVQFVHIFQAKNATKVHEIFNALRETTAQNTPASHLAASQNNQSSSNLAAKPEVYSSKLNHTSNDDNSKLENHSKSSNENDSSELSTTSLDKSRGTNNINIDNSYQFEVMFVKRVKLQCRRVPASFVDDALETLKSFEVLKINDSKVSQIKSKSRPNTIINGTLDERQEYDQQELVTAPEVAVQSSQSNYEMRRNSEQGEKNLIQDPSIKSQKDAADNGSSRSCQHTPTKQQQQPNSHSPDQLEKELDILKKHSSLENLNGTRKLQQEVDTSARYSNDFSPYNTITSGGLNERIAAIPAIVSNGTVSLDHETRQKLARQVRQTIQATAANIKKDVYNSTGSSELSQLKSRLSFKAINSLSCTVASEVPPIDDHQNMNLTESSTSDQAKIMEQADGKPETPRRSSAAYIQSSGAASMLPSSNNFDLFRRASARQVVKNRTMLLLIGKEELCTISIDKHQMLFSKSFSQIMHCLQGHNNRDHFGLICRDSQKIQPNAESYAGFIFKCQSEKVVREIMAALKQVIYNSQHNYDGYYSPYNPIHQSLTKSSNMSDHRHGLMKKLSTDMDLDQAQKIRDDEDMAKRQMTELTSQSSLSNKRSPPNLDPLKIDEAVKQQQIDQVQNQFAATAPVEFKHQPNLVVATQQQHQNQQQQQQQQPKVNLIRTMFCDNCPLYWYHRLCCDIESLPMDASKAIILRRIDSSLSEREQDELYSKFSEHQINSIEDHNVIFMSLLRHLCESKQTKHAQTSAHINALAKNKAILKQQHSVTTDKSPVIKNQADTQHYSSNRSHTRSGSTGGGAGALVDSIDNLKKAKNTISVSIENMLKRRPSNPRDQLEISTSTGSSPPNAISKKQEQLNSNVPIRSGSLRGLRNLDNSRLLQSGSKTDAECSQDESSDIDNQLKRSQSSSNPYGSGSNQLLATSSWRDSFHKTIQDSQDLANPFVDFFRRRNTSDANGNGNRQSSDEELRTQTVSNLAGSSRMSSTECLSVSSQNSTKPMFNSPKHCNTPNLSSSTETFYHGQPSMLSGVFWKKSLFDKIRQPTLASDQKAASADIKVNSIITAEPEKKRSKQELRDLWKKAIVEQITLLKMEKQNKSLAGSTSARKNEEKQPIKSHTNHCQNLISSSNHDPVGLKLNYKDIPYPREANFAWDRILKQDAQKKVEFVEVARLVRLGVPKLRRGEVWMFLMNQYQLRHGTSYQPADEFQGDANQPYRGLLTQLSVQQHEIFVDIDPLAN